ncbi:hypothetical protein A6A25_30690 [Saccharothrix sp. CB00851]|nr:hypothetical protein A6A25_30690 [Saccharothrix sp. CB00851]
MVVGVGDQLVDHQQHVVEQILVQRRQHPGGPAAHHPQRRPPGQLQHRRVGNVHRPVRRGTDGRPGLLVPR